MQRTAIAVLALCFVMNMLGRGFGDTYAVYLLPLEREFGWSRSSLTGVFSLYLLVNGFAAPLVGLAFDRLGPRWVYAGGLAIMGLGFWLASGLASLAQFYLYIGVLVGVSVSLLGMVPASALLARWYRARLATAIGIAFSAVGVGALICVPLSQWLIEQTDWRSAYRATGLALLALAPLVALALPWRRLALGAPEHRPAAAAAAAGGRWTWRAAVRSRMYWALSAAFFCTATAMFTVIVQTVICLIEAGFPPATAAAAYGVTGMLSTISVAGAGFVAARYGFRQTVTVSFAGSATGVVLLAALGFHPSGVLLALFVLVFGLCQGVRGPIISTIATRHFAGPQASTIYGTIYSANALGAAFGALMGGVLHDLTGSYLAGYAFSLAFFALAVLPFWLVRELRGFRQF